MNSDASLFEIESLVQKQNEMARSELVSYIQEMDPNDFELLIKYVLGLMGYENVEVTSPTRDGGVDLVAEIEVGIFRVREAFQVKRQKLPVRRPVLDSFRGSLHRFGAWRATFITTGSFTSDANNKAYEHGAIPITLVDGDTLADMLIQHEVGVKVKEVSFLTYDEMKLHLAPKGALKVRKTLAYKKWRW